MNTELEYGIIGDFLYNLPEKTYELSEMYGLKPEHFKDNMARRAYEKILELKTRDRMLIAREIMPLVGEPAVEKAIERANNTNILDIEERIRRVVNSAKKEELAALVNQKLVNGRQDSITAAFLADDLANAIKALNYTDGAADSGLKPMLLSDLGPVEDENTRKDALFENGWLRKGHAAFLTSVSGSGKSVITMQLCYSWALGEAMFDIKPLKPLKIAVFQTEDDNDELRFFREAMHFNYKLHYNWTDEKLAEAEKNILFFKMNGEMGDKFISYFREVQRKYKADLAIINPFQGVTDFDIANNADVRTFIRGKIDPIIKDEEHGCGLFIVHHTNKPPNAKERGSFGKDAFAQYAGAGGAEINNWMRAGFIIMPETTGGYQFVATKRGARLNGWKKREGHALPLKYIKHSDDGAHNPFWLEFDPVEEKAEAERAEAREDAEDIEKILDEDCKTLASMVRTPVSATLLREMARNKFGTGRGRTVYKYLSENFPKYNLMQRKGVNNNEKLIGTLKMFETMENFQD